MKKAVLFFSFFFLFAALPLLHATTKVTVYFNDNYPPYSYLQNGKAKGIYVDIMTKAFSRMEDYEVTLKGEPWKRGLKMIKRGTYFAIFPAYYRPETRTFMDYSEPILEEKLVVFLNESTVRKRELRNWPFDFYGMKIGRNSGFDISRNKDFLVAVEQGRITLEDAKDNSANILKLGMGRIDAYVNDRLSILWELNRLKKEGVFDEGGRHEKILEGITLSVKNRYLGITNQDKGKFEFKEDFLKKFNTIILEMKNIGEIEEIIVDGYLAN